MGRRRFLGVVAVLTCALAPPALAQDPDVIVDPDSPSAKEYAIPLERARHEATGAITATAERKGKARVPRVTPLFGVGVTAQPSTGKPMRPPKSGAQRRVPRRVARSRVDRIEPTIPELRSLAATPAGGIGDVALLAAGGGTVLLLGALLGVAVRRRPGAPRGV